MNCRTALTFQNLLRFSGVFAKHSDCRSLQKNVKTQVPEGRFHLKQYSTHLPELAAFLRSRCLAQQSQVTAEQYQHTRRHKAP
jgi:hypothetical protein